MKILVFNAGSSSLKFGVFDTSLNDWHVVNAEFKDFTEGQCELHYWLSTVKDKRRQQLKPATNVNEAIQAVPALLEKWGYDEFDVIGHRVVHGGEQFSTATCIDNNTLPLIEAASALAPLHNPDNLAGIYLSLQVWPEKSQFAVFDTAFHHTIPEVAYRYAIPERWREEGVRRYGFHGTSHHYIALRTSEAMHRPLEALRIISCHLGNGASVCAIDQGISVDTSMGMTPLEGLVMGTRSGDIDPGIMGYLSRQMGLSIEEIEHQLYHQSGLLALAGSADFREIEKRAAEKDSQAQLAIDLYAYRVRKYLGAYTAIMGGLDALVFTGGVGENSAMMRQRICDQLDFLGLSIDVDKNRALKLKDYQAQIISSEFSNATIIVTQTCEQLMIAREIFQHLNSTDLSNQS